MAKKDDKKVATRTDLQIFEAELQADMQAQQDILVKIMDKRMKDHKDWIRNIRSKTTD